MKERGAYKRPSLLFPWVPAEEFFWFFRNLIVPRETENPFSTGKQRRGSLFFFFLSRLVAIEV